ncbi:MAG: GNAT family N-acetyltransferase [Thermomicrobiales bacterium]
MSDVTIRAAISSDANALDRICASLEVTRDSMRLPYETDEERSEQIANSDTIRTVAAELDGEVVGFGRLHLFERRRAHAARIELVIDPNFSKAGVGAELLNSLIELGEHWYGIRRFEARVFTEDDRAIQLYERAGFGIEATHRQHAMRDGEYADAFTMARLDE